MNQLLQRIERRQASLGVIGLGYVGLPLAVSFAKAGFRVACVDRDRARVAEVGAGACEWLRDEPGFAAQLAEVVASGALSASDDYQSLADAEVVLIAVDTPVSQAPGQPPRPEYRALRAACTALAEVVREGTLVILESTVAPGTTLEICKPLLSSRVPILVGHCPERLTPGRLMHNIRHMPRVCGGESEAATTLMLALYRHIVEALLEPADCVTAELTKTAENAYRDVNIAFANELSLVCQARGASFARVRELVNQVPGRAVLWAGGGVGGHCIPKDSWLLAHGAPEVEPRLLAAARARNDDMPAQVLALLERALATRGRAVAGATVALLGVAYLENCGDVRSSPTLQLAALLRARGAEVTLHDEHLTSEVAAALGVVPLPRASAGAVALVTMVEHREYRELEWHTLERGALVIDARRAIDREQAERAGFAVWRLGEGR